MAVAVGGPLACSSGSAGVQMQHDAAAKVPDATMAMDAAARLCTPGKTLSCACPGSAKTGVHVCASTGASFGACTGCALPDASDARTPPDAGAEGGRDAGDGSVDSAADASPEAGRNFTGDAAAFFGASRCEDAGVLLCDGFETGMLDTSVWTVGGTAPVIDGIHAARGIKALHITVNGAGASYIDETKTFPVPNDTYFGRAFVWFEKLPVDMDAGGADGGPVDYSHWTIVAASGTVVDGQIRVSGQMHDSLSLFGVGTDNRVQEAGTGDWTLSDNDPAGHPNPVPLGAWVCIEWMHAGNTNETRFYWNDVEHPSLDTTSTVHGGNTNPFILPQFTNVWLGWQEYQPMTETFELWIDEVAIDTARIGCVL
jgi:hypothetical protein